MLSTTTSSSEPDDECEEVVDMGCVLFPDYQRDTRHFLFSVHQIFSSLATFTSPFNFVLAIVGIAVSLLHISVLSRRSMRTSSSNIILLGIAFCDVVSLLNNLKASYHYVFNGDECALPTSLLTYQINLIVDSFLWTFRRVSPWLGVCLGVIRYLAVRFFMNSETFTRPRVGVLTIFVSFSFGVFFSVFAWMQVYFPFDKEWSPEPTCPNYIENQSYPVYKIESYDFFFGPGDTIMTKFTFWNGTFSKVIPSICFPILTALLLGELAKKKWRNRHVVNSRRNLRAEKTTVLITLMTITFLLAELPLGIITATESMFLDVDEHFGIIILLTLMSTFWNSIFSLNAAFHCLLCFGLSAQYRDVAGGVFKNSISRTTTGSRVGDVSGTVDRGSSRT